MVRENGQRWAKEGKASSIALDVQVCLNCLNSPSLRLSYNPKCDRIVSIDSASSFLSVVVRGIEI